MNVWFMFVSCLISIFMIVGVMIYVVWFQKDTNHTKRDLKPIQIITIWSFLAILVAHLPVYFNNWHLSWASFVQGFVNSVLHSFSVFTFGDKFDKVVDAMGPHRDSVEFCYSLYMGMLYLIAPVLTISNVVFLFKNLWDEFRYRIAVFRNYYIMSELNEKSIALANSIRNDNKNAVIVFTNVREENEDTVNVLRAKAGELKAICLKKDITNVKFLSKKGDVEIFLIGNDESKNISQAAKLTTMINAQGTRKEKPDAGKGKLRAIMIKISGFIESKTRKRRLRKIKRNIKVFAFSMQPSAVYIIDSVKYENLISASDEYDDKGFKLRRINEKQQLIWNTVPKMKVFDIADRHNKTLSVMIVGFGKYGVEFFKMLTWYCQFEGYQLQINIFDKQSDTDKDLSYLERIIKRNCPELMKKNRCDAEGEAHYDIELFSGVDVQSSDLDELLLYDGDDQGKRAVAERLKRTNLAIVSLGDDDINIEASIHLRHLFDRIHRVQAKADISWADEVVDIYSIVYDDEKCRILYDENGPDSDQHILVNHKNVPYHIHFIGSLSTQFSYQNIYNADLERRAYAHHTGWADIEEKIHDEWLRRGDFVHLNSRKWSYRDAKTKDALIDARKNYEQYEYYRLSSIAKELYKREISSHPLLKLITQCEEYGKQTCRCGNCVRRKRSEHMRWNAYTRTIGFSYLDDIRADRALLHNDLKEWRSLTDFDRLKD